VEIKVQVAEAVPPTGDIPEAVMFLKGLWASMSPKDPINVMVVDHGKPTIQYPKKGAKKDRKVTLTVPFGHYKPGITLRACVKAIRLDPVAAALRGELYMQEFEETKLATPGEGIIFLACYMAWNALRKYKLAKGRKGKAGSARYAFAGLREFRAKQLVPEAVG